MKESNTEGEFLLNTIEIKYRGLNRAGTWQRKAVGGEEKQIE